MATSIAVPVFRCLLTCPVWVWWLQSVLVNWISPPSSRLSIIATLFLVFPFLLPVIPWPDAPADIGQILVLIFSSVCLQFVPWVFGGV